MTKSPAFQFYPDDFLGSGKVGTMTVQEVGAYFLLLCLEWNEVGFVYDEEELSRWCKLSRPAFRKAWKRISRCFVERDGRLFNPRLDLEREKQREWREKSVKGGRASAEARRNHGSTMVQPPTQPKGNTPSPSPTPISKTTTSAPKEPARASWLIPASRIWEARFGAGSFAWPKFGKQLKPLKAHHPPALIADRLQRYLTRTDPQFVSIPRFVSTFAQYAPVDANALVDEYGCLTPFGEQETTKGLRIA